jgi:hypothetical protein
MGRQDNKKRWKTRKKKKMNKNFFEKLLIKPRKFNLVAEEPTFGSA